MATTGKKQLAAASGRTAQPAEHLLALHGTMALLRAADEVGARLSRTGRIGMLPSAAGTEAVLAGVASSLQPGDWVLPGVRQASIALARGAALPAWFAQLHGTVADPARGRQEPGHVALRALHVVSVSTPAGSQLVHAMGVARAMKYRRRPDVAVALCGQAATSTADFHVALNFAAVGVLPVVFVVTTGEGLSELTAAESVAIKARAYGMPGVEVDGADVLAVAGAMTEALDRARSGEGPTLVDARCPSPIRPGRRADLRVVGEPSTEQPLLSGPDPLDRLESELTRRGHATAEALRLTRERLASDVAAAADAASQLPPPPGSLLFEGVFARRTPALSAQRAEWLASRQPKS